MAEVVFAAGSTTLRPSFWFECLVMCGTVFALRQAMCAALVPG